MGFHSAADGASEYEEVENCGYDGRKKRLYRDVFRSPDFFEKEGFDADDVHIVRVFW